MTACASCGKGLTFGERALGRTLCGDCSAKVKAERAAALAEYEQILGGVKTQGILALPAPSELDALEVRTGLPDVERKAHRIRAAADLAAVAAEDGLLTEAEDQAVIDLVVRLGLTETEVVLSRPNLAGDLAVAAVNAGRLPTISTALVLKKGEVAHLETPAQLLKEVVHREMRGGYSGISFRVAKGVRVHAGGVRAHSVVTGTTIEAADSGLLTITSQRAVFRGQRQGIDLPYGKLLSLNTYDDGVGFVMANRAKVPLFKVASGALVVAYINAAVSRA